LGRNSGLDINRPADPERMLMIAKILLSVAGALLVLILALLLGGF
jgi:hypothetical protein